MAWPQTKMYVFHIFYASVCWKKYFDNYNILIFCYNILRAKKMYFIEEGLVRKDGYNVLPRAVKCPNTYMRGTVQ